MDSAGSASPKADETFKQKLPMYNSARREKHAVWLRRKRNRRPSSSAPEFDVNDTSFPSISVLLTFLNLCRSLLRFGELCSRPGNLHVSTHVGRLGFSIMGIYNLSRRHIRLSPAATSSSFACEFRCESLDWMIHLL